MVLIRYLTATALKNYLWFIFGGLGFAGTTTSNTNDQQPVSFGGFTSAEDGPALNTGSAAEPWIC